MTDKLEHCEKCECPTKDENQIGYMIEGVLLCWACASEELKMEVKE